jgi:hypothetical protein
VCGSQHAVFQGKATLMRRLSVVAVLFILAVAGCSTSSDPSATFTGSACDYSGPSEFDVGSEVTFTYTNESNMTGAGFAVWKFPEGLTSEEIFEQGIFNATNDGSSTDFFSPPTAIGQENEVPVTFTETGQHGVVCWVSPGPEAGSDYVTMFTVIE